MHHYGSIVENRRVMGGRILQRHVLYLGEFNGSQEAVWRRILELFGLDPSAPQQASLFPETHLPEIHDSAILNIGIRISQTATLTYRLDRYKLRVASRREGRYLPRTNRRNTCCTCWINSNSSYPRPSPSSPSQSTKSGLSQLEKISNLIEYKENLTNGLPAEQLRRR